jgi:hypothetical protein
MNKFFSYSFQIVLILSVFITAGCASHRFNRVIGMDKTQAIDLLGMPIRSVKLDDGREIWAYPVSYQSTSSVSSTSSDSIGGALVEGIGEGISEITLYNLFGDGPYRYVFFNKNNIAENWEVRRR